MEYRLLIGFLMFFAFLIAWGYISKWLTVTPEENPREDFCNFCGHEKPVSQIEGFTLICADCRVENVSLIRKLNKKRYR